MEKFEVTILGCGSATPTLRHNPSAQVVNVRDKLSLVDCGEGTQMQLRRYQVKFMALRNAFISHLHGDHCLGLTGLVSSFGLLGRTKDFHIYAPAGLQEILEVEIKNFCHNLDFEVMFHVIDPRQHLMIYEDRSMEVWTLPLHHSVECCGFLFKEKPSLPHINREMVDFYNIPVCYLQGIKEGNDWTTADGTVIPHARLVTPAAPPRTYAYCSDTTFLPSLVPMVRGVNLLYHEATYDNDRAPKALARFHSTAGQAAQIAQMAEVHKLMIGHFSASIKDDDILLQQAQEVFPRTILAQEGLVVEIK